MSTKKLFFCWHPPWNVVSLTKSRHIESTQWTVQDVNACISSKTDASTACNATNVKPATTNGPARYLGDVHPSKRPWLCYCIVMAFQWMHSRNFFRFPQLLCWKWIRTSAQKLAPKPTLSPGTLVVLELDEMWHYIGNKKNKFWIWKAFDRNTGCLIDWQCGGRNRETLKNLPIVF